jgi:hypothetical protein
LSFRSLAVLALLCLLAAAPAARAADGDAGRVHFAKHAASEFDRFTSEPSAAQREWMRDHYARMKTWAPYFDSRLEWYSDAWAYRDAYAIYRGSARASQHPEWILKDASGNKLYIPYGCGGGSCPQYAADIGNPDFRRQWIAEARSTMAEGYKGLYIDDVNMQWRVGDGSGRSVWAMDPRTGQRMTEATWQRYMADFMEEVRRAIPDKEIVHNVIWYSRDSADTRRQLRAADVIGLERGFNDDGLTNGDGTWAWRTFVDLIQRVHADGGRVLLDTHAEGQADRLYGLAAYLLVNNGRDFLGNGASSDPDNWWKGYDVELGDARGKAYLVDGVWRRDFERGSVFVNEPDEPRRSVNLGGTALRDLGGARQQSLTLGPAAGAILLRDGVDPSVAAGSPPAAAPAKPAPTAAGLRPASGVRLRVRVRSARGALRVAGVVRGATSGRVLVSARSASGRRAARAALRLGRSGRFARRLRTPAGRWRVRVEYRGTVVTRAARVRR